MNDGLTVQVAEAIGEVMRELLAVAENTPIKPERAAPTARILSGLAGQLRDTAAMLAPRADGSIPAGDERVSCDDVLKIAAFWSEVLGRPLDKGSSEVFASIGGADGSRREPAWYFNKVPESKRSP